MRAIDDLEAAGDVEEAARATVFLARTYWWLEGNPEAHDESLDRALALVGSDPDSPSRVAALAQRAGALNARGHAPQALEVIEEALPSAERLGLQEHRARLLELRGTARTSLGDEGGFADLDEAIALATEARAFAQLHTALNNKASRQVALGRLAEARPTLEAMQANLENDPNIGTRRWAGALAVELHHNTGEWDQAMREADEWLAEADAGSTHVLEPSVRMLRAAMLAARGELERAARDVEIGLAQTTREGRANKSQNVARAAWMFLLQGRRNEASSLFTGMLELGDRMIKVLNDGPIIDAAWAAHDLGRTGELVARAEAAPPAPWLDAAVSICAADFAAAAETCAEMGYRPGEAYARLRAARQLVDDGRRSEADVELQRSLAFWREVGATRYVREGEALLAASA